MMVFVAHTLPQITLPGHATLQYLGYAINHMGGEGVRFFFVLSGFLITWLLCAEIQQKGKINIGHFYIRRALRIWPAYYAVTITGLFILPHVAPMFSAHANKAMVLTFLSNFDLINCRLAKIEYPVTLGLTWSVSVEEQFYLVWPLLLTLIVGNRYVFYATTLCIVVLGFAFRWAHIDVWELSFLHTVPNLSYLMIGSMAAYYMRHGSGGSRLIAGLSRYRAGLFAIWVFCFFTREMPQLSYPVALLTPVLYVLLILLVSFGQVPFMDRLTTLRKLGKYTYGMYLYHMTAVVFTTILFTNKANSFLIMGVAYAVTLAMAYISYQYFEKRFLKLKEKFNPL